MTFDIDLLSNFFSFASFLFSEHFVSVVSHRAKHSNFFDLQDAPYSQASALILSFVVNNYPKDDERSVLTRAWEKAYLKMMEEWESEFFDLAYFSEVCIALIEGYIFFVLMRSGHDHKILRVAFY